jgi:glycosyltransferase involved in cell wall biosynthesis
VRILFLHEVNYLEKPIFEMHEFPEHLAALGHEIAFVQFPEGLSSEEVKGLGWKAKISGRVLAQQRLTLYTPQNASGTLLGRLKTAFTFKRSFSEVVEDFRPDVVVSFSVPTSGWQSLKVTRKLGIPYVFRALDVSHKIRKSPFAGLIKLAERYIYEKSDQISANNPAMVKYCISMGADATRTVVDLPPLDLRHFEQSPTSKAAFKTELGIRNEVKVILYMGSFFYFSGLPEAIRRFAELKHLETELVLVGGGEQDNELRKIVSSLGIEDKVHFTGFVKFAELPKYLGVADVAINPMHRSLVSNAAFPNKVIQYMASALPVASTKLDGLELTFGQLQGLRFSETSEGVIDEAVRLLREGNLAAMGKLNRTVVAELFSVDRAVRGLESRLKGALHSND